MIKLVSILKEFNPRVKGTPTISYGNEKMRTSTLPSLQNQDMNAEIPTHPIPEEEVCVECGSPTNGVYCSQCDQEENEDGDVWGQPSDDHEATMAKAELKDMISNATKLYNTIKPGTELPGWVSAYITLASDYMHSVAEYASENS